MSDHDRDLSCAFDAQAVQFEKAPVQSDPQALAGLVRFAALPAGAEVLDVGCGPGLVAEALLESGLSIVGVDLSAEMVERARRRCERFGTSCRFEVGSIFDPELAGPFDATISRYVLHHVEQPDAFLARQFELVRPGGVAVLCDHTTDSDPKRAAWHQEIERLRDRTHTRNLSPEAILDLFAAVGFRVLRHAEEPFELDFDEWFDRGSPTALKVEVRALLAAGLGARGFQVEARDGRLRIACWRSLVRGVKPPVPAA